MSSVGYITYPQLTDPQDLMQQAFTYLQQKFPGWQPAEGNLDTWLIEAFASEAADIQTLSSQVPITVFRYMGAKLFQIQPVDAISSVCTVQVTATDALGHTVPAGTQMSILDSSGNDIPFQTMADGVITAGATTVTVTLIAVNPGSAPNGAGSIGGAVNLIDPLVWVLSVTQQTALSGGVDAELDSDYLDRLRQELQTLSPRPILAKDFSTLARNVSGVQRAVTIDGYNPANQTSNNERMVTVYAVDPNGVAVPSGIRAQVAAYLDPLREINFVVNMDDPVSVRVSVTTAVTVLPGYAAADVASRVSTAISDFLNPASWGCDPADNPNHPITWTNTKVINYLQLATEIGSVTGVNIISSLVLGAHGGALSAANYTMTGNVPLPLLGAGDLTVTAS